ncbi:hypothetical protein BZM27_24710 [Paraburkholderia steynii]|uniref:Tetrapyrrole methylase domain-containing protein n=1 Tax=Paraburkholderia steynii TaxID=1245441 RepID=A0A4R0XD64_9BURK|nr:hypothetical protein BZM27_24710 [Paraburkholderia steynii]
MQRRSPCHEPRLADRRRPRRRRTADAQAARTLALADVVLVDDLVNPEVLHSRATTRRSSTSASAAGSNPRRNPRIVAMMLDHLRAGRSVARLKGGDPFVFGRGGEEQQALQAAGIHVEIISGITAGIAAPAAIGIPVTHRDHAQGVIFVTGHGAGEHEAVLARARRHAHDARHLHGHAAAQRQAIATRCCAPTCRPTRLAPRSNRRRAPSSAMSARR